MGTSRANAAGLLTVHARQIKGLVAERGLNRELEALPTDKEIRRRTEAGLGLTSPELSTLMAYVKLALKDELLGSELPDQEVFAARLPEYFPHQLRDRFGPEIRTHQLRREIVTTMLVNDLVDTAGISYAYRVAEDVGVGPVDAVRAYVATDEIFRVGEVWRQIRAAGDAGVPVAVTDRMTLDLRRLIDRAGRWLLELPAAAAGGGRRGQPVRREGRRPDAADVGVAARRRPRHRGQGLRGVHRPGRARGAGDDGRDGALPVQPARRHRHRRHRRARPGRGGRHLLHADGPPRCRRPADRDLATGSRRSVAFVGALGDSRRHLRFAAGAVLRRARRR